ncbi:hypothetical protein H2200_000750 [Cladophialophora chaetospira]|uniref:Zn(2)-C6 fungal-type domain-containing protein n=1 Tax=Cladophialophora chaetospira TaxID=386627 RepID=A0AA38XP45_9EURO|nr:hypothetical protein H2200_000750 [Cladophialophora chaetospira]
MAAGVVLPLESRFEEWRDTEHKFRLCPTLNETPRLLSGSMARPPPAAEPREDTFSQKPSLPPFSKFLSDAGQPDLFAPSRTPQIRENPSLPVGASLNKHLVQSSPFRPSDPYPVPSIDPQPQARNGHREMQNGQIWPYQNTSPLATHTAVPGAVTANLSGDRSAGPAFLREEVIPGRGLCYVYDDGSVIQKIINGDAVNPKWGTTKAGKPRKRLGQACNTCREKKIKCDPSVPKCAQCQKFGRECKFDSASRSGPRPPGSTTSMSMASPSIASSHIQAEHASRRGSSASTDLVAQEQVFPRASPRSSMPLETLLSPTSNEDYARDESPDSRPPTKRLRVSLSPQPASEGWPSESVGSESAAASIASPSAMPKFCWQVDPFQLDPQMTMHYTNKYFHHVDSATTCILPRKKFLRWIRESSTKSPTDRMLLYAILAMGTVFARRPESKLHQDVFIDIVNRAVMKSGDTFSLQLVQTKLILALFTFSQGQYNQAWDFCGSALRVAFGLKFHTEEGIAAIGNNDGMDFDLDHATLKECRRRAFWSAYIMDCFNGCCSASVTSVNRADCHLRLPCSQSAYDKGEIPLTSFNLENLPGRNKEISEVGVLGYLVEIATIFSEVVSKISKSKPQATAADRSAMETFHRTTLRRLDEWDHLTEKHLHQGREGRERVNGLHIMYHYTAMILHRYVHYSEAGQIQISNNVRGAHEHAQKMLEMVQRVSNQEERETSSFRFATLSPFSGFAITAALDVITAAGTVAELINHESMQTNGRKLMTLISNGVEALEGLVDFWHSACRQRDMMKQRLSALLNATNRGADCNGAFYFGRPMQSPFGLDQDIVYGLSRIRYFQGLGLDDRIHHEADFRRLD